MEDTKKELLKDEHNDEFLKQAQELINEAQVRYEREVRLRKELLTNAVIYYRINLSNQMVEEMESQAVDVTGISLPISLPDLIQGGLFKDVYEEDLPLLKSKFDTKALLEGYESGKRGESFEYRRYLPGKGLRWLRASIAKLKRVSSDDVIAFFTAEDIDDEKKEQILYRDVLNEEVESLITMKLPSRMIRVLKEIFNLPGVDRSNPSTDYFMWDENFVKSLFSEIVPEDLQQAKEFLVIHHILDQLETKSVLQVTFRTEDKHGIIRRKKVRVFYLDESKQELVFVRRDITDLYNEQQRQANRLKEAMNATKKANEAKSVFLSRMSHDMRTPLDAIIGYSGDLLREGATEAQKDTFLNDIHTAGEYLLGIINDVLDMTKIESNKMVLHKEPYSYEDFLQSIQTVIAPLCEKKGIHFKVSAFEDVEQLILVDKVRFNQIFVNILSNAVKFTPKDGTVSFDVQQKKLDDGHVDMTFIISDTGCGMSEDFLPHAFDSFSQEYEGQALHNEQGTGLGLSIVKQLVLLMGGTVDVASKLGEGTTFTIHMCPRLASNKEDEKETAYPANGLKGLHILLCEDHPMNRKIAIALLEREGCQVDIAVDGKMGVDVFKESRPDTYQAILMDIRMPVMDGLEAAKAIRSLKRADAAEIPIIAMTANAFNEDKRASSEAGMNAHVAKPIDPQILYQTLYRYCTRKQVVRTPKVLVVDDMPMNADIVARALRGYYETEICTNGKEAMNILKENPYIIAVITDVQMPEMSGEELVHAIRSNPNYDRVAIIANTEFGNSRLEEDMLRSGADDFIYKPTAPSLILQRLNSVLRKYQL